MRPRVLGHRGASGSAFENSLAAFRRARELGADGVELDVHATRDGALLVHHDPLVPGIGLLPKLPAAAFAGYRLPNEEPLPTLEQALESLEGMEVWIEIKGLDGQFDQQLLEVIDRSPTPALCAVHGFDHRIIARLGGRRPALRRGVLLASYLLDTPAAVLASGASVVWQEASLIDRELVVALHAAGLGLIAWTVNDDSKARELAELGVDGLCGNDPDRLLAALGEGRATP